MLSRTDFIRKSLETHLFWARIMKEHLIFIIAGAVSKDVNIIRQAHILKDSASALLAEAINLSNGVLCPGALESQQFVTENTLPAELKTQNLTGIPVNPALTEAEMHLMSDGAVVVPGLELAVHGLNQRGIILSAQIAEFKGIILNAVLSCNIFTWNFPLLIDHIRREALMYNANLRNLEAGVDPVDPALAPQLEAFWNRIMEEHALFIRQYLDPTEEELFETANSFAKRFDTLKEEAEAAAARNRPVRELTRRSLTATREIRDFKEQGTEGILMCQIKSLIAPLLGDHVTREANHYIRILNVLQAKR